MAKKFYDQDEAAALLGITVAQLIEMRTRNEIRGYRDGATWKFKFEEVDKVAADLKAKAAEAADDVGIGIGNEPTHEVEGGSVLLSERELGSGPTTSSTIIGKSSSLPVSSDSDIQLAKGPRNPQESSKPDSDVKLARSESSGVLGSEVVRAGTPEPGSDVGLQFEELDSLELDFDDNKKKKTSPANKPSGGAGQGGSDAAKPTADKVPSGDSSVVAAGEPLHEAAAKAAGGSDPGGSALDLSGDDDLVLGGSGSDVTGKPGDSGISLMDPSDSGLSLDEPMELGGSALEGGSLVLGEDDMITLGGDADVSAATQLRSDDDFLLTPSAGGGGEDSESGSQVIALESTEGFDQDAATQIVGAGAAMRMLEEDISGADTMIGGPGLTGGAVVMPGLQASSAAAMMVPAVPEAPYSIWNVLSLFVCVSLLCMVGMMMFDMMRHIWSWDQAYPINSSLMDAIVDMFFKKK